MPPQLERPGEGRSVEHCTVLGAASVVRGFLALAVFGLTLSLPIVVAVFWGRARGWLDRLAALSGRVPVWTGVVLVLLGIWSIYFGVAV